MQRNYVIAGFVLIALGVGLYFIGQNGLFGITECSGWNNINPICWAGLAVDKMFNLFMILMMVCFVVSGVILMLLEDASQLKWFAGFFLFLLLAAASWLLPDPIPFVDEILLSLGTGLFGLKTLSTSNTKFSF